MHLYRLSKAGFEDYLSGAGGLYAGGRWHERGQPILYTAETRALALLEVLANRQQRRLDTMRLLTYELPESAALRTLTIADLPPGWAFYEPYAIETVALGKQFLLEGTEAGLRVPSALMPEEHNVILHPGRALAAGLRVADMRNFALDMRLMP